MIGRRPSSASDATDQRHIHITERLVEGERKGMKIDDFLPLVTSSDAWLYDSCDNANRAADCGGTVCVRHTTHVGP